MAKNSPLILCLFLFSALANHGAKPIPLVDDYNSFEKYENQVIRIRGKISHEYMTHATLSFQDARHQIYVKNVRFQQAIVYVAKPWECKGAGEVTGTVIKVTSGDDLGESKSYVGFHIKAKSVRCL